MFHIQGADRFIESDPSVISSIQLPHKKDSISQAGQQNCLRVICLASGDFKSWALGEKICKGLHKYKNTFSCLKKKKKIDIIAHLSIIFGDVTWQRDLSKDLVQTCLRKAEAVFGQKKASFVQTARLCGEEKKRESQR